MSFNSLAVGIVQFLRANVTDPMGRSTNWIYIQHPRSNTITYPLIAVEVLGGSREPMSIGGTGDVYVNRYQIYIETDTDTQYTISEHTYSQFDSILYIADRVKDAIRDNRCLFTKTYGALDVSLSPAMLYPFAEGYDLYNGSMVLTVEINDPKT